MQFGKYNNLLYKCTHYLMGEEIPDLLLNLSKGGERKAKRGKTSLIKFRIRAYNQSSGFLKSTIAIHSTLLKWDI